MRCRACNAAIEYVIEDLCHTCLEVVDEYNQDLIEDTEDDSEAIDSLLYEDSDWGGDEV